jgi:hypothetical protein
MTDEARKARNEYAKQWRAKNATHVREYYKRWREANPDKVRANTKRYWERKAKELLSAGG